MVAAGGASSGGGFDVSSGEPVDLSGITLLHQTPPPSGVRALRAGEADATLVARRTRYGSLVVTMELGRLFTGGVKIYSEPSHTLLLVGLSREHSETAAGQELKKHNMSFTGSFPDAVHRFELPDAFPSDDVLLVYCIREAGDYLVGAARAVDGAFSMRAICRDCP